MIVIVDFGMGNLNSIKYKLEQSGIDVSISFDKEEIANASKLILPGVGHFKRAMENIVNLELKEVLDEQVLERKKPIFGICLGFQLFFSHSEEGNQKGLGWIDGQVKKFSFNPDNMKKTPHVGWNNIEILGDDIIFRNISKTQRFYFTHSYHVVCDSSSVLSLTDYGYKFTSSLRKDNIVGTQFHPEKSQKAGFEVLKNFCKYQ